MGSPDTSPPEDGLSTTFHDFCSQTTAHGLGHISGSRSPRVRTVWLGIVLGLLVALVYNVGVTLHSAALEQPIKTENTWRLGADGMDLPQTVFCDLSVFRQSKLDARNISDEMAGYLAGSIGGSTFINPDFAQDTDKQARLYREYQALLRPGETYRELIDSLSPACADVFTAADMGNDFIGGEQFCSQFITIVYTIRGRCFKVADVRQDADGKQFGTQYMLALPASEFPALDRTVIYGCIGTRIGVEALLDDRGTLPHLRVYTHSVAMSPQAAFELRVTREVTDRRGLRDTVFPALHRCAEANGSRPAESAANCPVLRLATAVAERCGCHWLSMPLVDAAQGLPLCSPQDVLSCVSDVEQSMDPADCPPACVENSYTTSVISAKMSPAMTMSAVNTREGGKLFTRVFFTSMQYRHARQWCQTGSEMLAEFGGHMGLFLGVSVVTVCEVLAALFGCLWDLCARRRRHVGSQPQHQPQPQPQHRLQFQPGGQGKQPVSAKNRTMQITFHCTDPLDDFAPPPAIYRPPPTHGSIA